MAGLVLVDCASSGTKMYLAVQRTRGGHVSNTEIRSLPGVLASLAQLKGQDAEPAEHELVSGFRAGLRESIAKSHRLSPAVPIRAIVVGLTSFWRPLTFGQRADVFYHVLERFRQVARELSRAPFCLEPLSEDLEALLERHAVVYAATNSRLACKSVDLVVSGGNSALNFTPPDKFPTPPTSVSLNVFEGKDVVKDQGVKVWQSECMVQLDRAAGLYCGELARQDPAPERIIVVAIGSVYWGGKFAGLAGELKEHPLQEVLQRFDAQLEASLWSTTAHASAVLDKLSSQLQAASPSAAEVKQTGGSDWYRDVANLIRVKACFERLFPEHLRHIVWVVFARDWVVKGERFRTTWTSGYFIKNCVDDRATFTPPHLLSSPVISPPDGGWLDLSSKASTDFESVLRFDDQEDLSSHEEPYSRRMELLPVMPAQLHSYSAPAKGELVWSRVAVSSALLGLGDVGQHEGLELTLPAADALSRFVVIGLVQCRSADTSHGAARPCPALGFNRRSKSLFPVVDLGINFDAKSASVSLQRGAVQKKRSTILGTRHFPWDPKAKETYHMWLERSGDGRVVLRLAKHRTPVLRVCSKTGKPEEYAYPFSESFLKLPVAVHVWVGVVGDVVDESVEVRGASWSNLQFSVLPKMPRDCRWRKGQWGGYASLAAERVRYEVQAQMPAWLAQSFLPHHGGEEGVRRLAAWPPHGNAGPACSSGSWPGFVVTAGEADVWIFSGHGEAMFHCSFQKARVWSVAVLDVQTTVSASSISILKKSSLQVRVLVGCEGAREGARTLEELHVIVDDPGVAEVCTLRERTVAGAGDQLTSAWCGHSRKVTGICVDHTRGGLVYTVSEDMTAAQWDKSGRLLCQARGFHSRQIYNCALSPNGLWLATAAFDHVALFGTDVVRGLTCAALIDLSWENPDLVRRWFSVTFLPKSLVDEVESSDELPSALLVGDMRGSIWLVSLMSGGQRRDSGGMTAFISASSAGLPLQPHSDCVRHLCWIEGDMLGSPVVAKRTEQAQRCRRCGSACGCCRRTLHRLFRKSYSLESVGTESGDVKLSKPLLCSMSSDKTIRVFDGKDVRSAYDILMQSQATSPSHGAFGGVLSPVARSPVPMPVKVSGKVSQFPERRTSVMLRGKSSVNFGSSGVPSALEITIHTGPVRAAGVDGYGRLYTASRHIAQWDELDKYNWGDIVLEPKLFIREALLLEVAIYFANIIFFAVQLLYFSSNRGSFTTDSQAKKTVAPIAALSRLSVLEPLTVQSVNFFPFWRTVFFLMIALMVVICPNVLRTYYDAETLYDLYPDDLANRKKQMRRKVRCYIISFLLFSILVIPTFEEFAMLLNCPVDTDGVRRMAADEETVCFVGWHLVMTVAAVVFGFFYLACGLLFETVNFNLRSLMESKLGEQAAFPPSTKYSCGRAVTLRRMTYVMFRHLLPDLNLELPRVKVGVFTETDWAVHSRQVRFVSKVLLAGCDKMEPIGTSLQMTATTCIALFNLLMIVTFPPLKDPRIRRMLELLHISVFFASATALAALWGPGQEQSPSFTPTLAVVYVIFAFAPLAHVAALAVRRHFLPSALRSAKVVEEPFCGSPASSGQLAPSERLGRLAWDDPSEDAALSGEHGLRRTAAGTEELDVAAAAARLAASRQPFVPDCRLETPTSSGEDMPARQASADHRQKTLS